MNESDMIQVNKVDNIIRKCMSQEEKKLKYSTHSYPWSSKLAFAILEVRLWKLIFSAITNKYNKCNRIESVLSQMRLVAVFLLPNPTERKNKNIVKKNLKTVCNNLKVIKKDDT